MTKRKASSELEERFALTMDTLGHDVLNNNQAVLSYLELLLANPGLDPVVRKYAHKAVSHVRISTTLIEDMREIALVRMMTPADLGRVDLVHAVNSASEELRDIFPGKKVRVDFATKLSRAETLGGTQTQDLIFNVLLALAMLDPGDDISIRAELKDGPAWQMTAENDKAEPPPVLGSGDFDSIYDQDVSTSAKLSCFLFARKMAAALGGGFEASVLGKKPSKGVRFTLTLGKAGAK